MPRRCCSSRCPIPRCSTMESSRRRWHFLHLPLPVLIGGSSSVVWQHRQRLRRGAAPDRLYCVALSEGNWGWTRHMAVAELLNCEVVGCRSLPLVLPHCQRHYWKATEYNNKQGTPSLCTSRHVDYFGRPRATHQYIDRAVGKVGEFGEKVKSIGPVCGGHPDCRRPWRNLGT